MAATANISIKVCVDGVDSVPVEMKDTFTDSVAPEASPKIPQLEQETADVAQVLDIVGIDTIRGILVKAIDGDVLIDTSFSATFSGELLIREGTSQYFCPTGTVYFKNSTASEKVKVGYLVFGTQD